jgi:hypothetical protein
MSDALVDLVVVHNNQIILLIGIVCVLFVGAFISVLNFRDMEKLVVLLAVKIEELEKAGSSTEVAEYQPIADV